MFCGSYSFLSMLLETVLFKVNGHLIFEQELGAYHHATLELRNLSYLKLIIQLLLNTKIIPTVGTQESERHFNVIGEAKNKISTSRSACLGYI